jgi:hypothetical protein
VRPQQRLANDEALGEGDAGERAEMGVAALDELLEARRGQAGLHPGRCRWRELRAMTGQRAPFAVVLPGHVHRERRGHRIVDEVIADPLDPPRVLGRAALGHVRRETGQSAVEDRARQYLAGRPVVGVPVAPVGHRDGSRAAPAQQIDGLRDLLVAAGDAAVRPPEVHAPVGAEHGAGGLRLELAFLGCAVRAELAPCQIAQADPITLRDVQGDGAGEPDFDVVGMRPEGQQVDRGDAGPVTGAGGTPIARSRGWIRFTSCCHPPEGPLRGVAGVPGSTPMTFTRCAIAASIQCTSARLERPAIA